jgi:predicted small lipoprotein YifL
MRTLILRFISIFLLSAVTLTGCASKGSEYLGKWVNTKNPNDTFQVTRNGDEYLIIGQEQKPGVGAIYKDGALEVKGALLSADLTYVKRTDTILAPGFFGQIEYKRQE